MVKIKQIKTNKSKRKARITVKSLMLDVKKKLNKEKVTAVMKILEDKYRCLDTAKKVVSKLKQQIAEIEDMDIEDIDTEDFEYEE